MKTVIINRTDTERIPRALVSILPFKLTDEIRRLECGMIEEIRLRRDRCATLNRGGRNIILDSVVNGEQMDEIFLRLCGGSLYAHTESIAQGYISIEGGIRVGVCGHAALERGRIIGVSRISSLVIRLPHAAPAHVGEELARLVREGELCGGILVYSKPGVGKTTVLRGAAAHLASGEQPLRVAVIDTRGELAYSLDAPRLTVDILTGYPKRQGIEMAVRTLGAQVMVCDEIGDSDEAAAIISAHNCGVPLLASAHAGSMAELMKKPGIVALHKSCAFSKYVGLSRRQGRQFDYEYTVTDREDADVWL